MNLPAAPPRTVSPTALLTGEEARAYAKNLSESDMLSSFFQGSVANVMFAMELGRSYNLEPAALLQNIHVFETWKDGKCTLKASLSANLMVHLARNAGHIVTTKANQNKASCTIVRGDTIFAKMLRGDIAPDELAHYSNILSTLKEMEMDPKAYAVTESVWTMDKALTAGLIKEKGNWVKYPHAMLAARSKADAVRMACEEVLITINNDADRIGGGFQTRDGQAIAMSWTHLADELGGSINEEDGSYVPIDKESRSTAVQAAPPVQATAPAPQREDSSAKADIAAQASADPSRAGWGKQAEPAPEPKKDPQAAQAAQVRAFVEAKPFEETLSLIERTATAEGMSDSERTARLEMLLSPVAELCTTDQIVQVLTTVPGCTDAALVAIADYAQANKVAEILQEITLGDADNATRLSQAQTVYARLKEHDRLDDPAPFYDKAKDQGRDVNLGSAVKLLVQPLIKSV